MNNLDFMTKGGASPRRNLSREVRALVLLGVLAYTRQSDTVSLARLMRASTRTIKRAMSALEAEGLVLATRRGSAPTIWSLDTSRISDHQRIELQAYLLAWLAAQRVEAIHSEDVWNHLTQRAWHYARHDERTSPRVLGTMIADETKSYAHQRERALDSFFQELQANG